MMTTISETKRGLTALVVWAAMLLSVVVLMLASGCSKESDYLHDAEAQPLTFSSDTVMFDTVFVAMGTTTHHFMVYNRGSKPVKIASVSMQQGAASRFRLNVDGDSSRVVRNVTLAAGDSLFVFIQALIDPTDEASPFLVTDAVVFDVEGCATQQLLVTAYGRNAVYHLPTDTLMKGTLDRYGNPYAYSIIDCDNWDHTLPHVIVGYAVVYDDTLHLKAGDELYFANDAVLWVFNEASLRVSGNEEHPVLFTSVRHDGWYGTLPGQWGHIWLGGISGGTCRPCVISHAVIENAYYGIIADSNAYGYPTLYIDHCEICHHKVAGLQLDDAWVVGSRLLLYDCGGATIYVPFGGRYTFDHITSANYWRLDHRTTPSVILRNWYESVDGVVPRNLVEATFTNSIIYGNRSEGELLLDGIDGARFEVNMANSVVRGKLWYDVDPRFVDIEANDYHLSDDSPAQGLGYYAEE